MLQSLMLKLQTTEEDSSKLIESVKRYNEACNFIADKAFSTKLSNKRKLQKIVYYDVREKFGLSSQFVIRAIASRSTKRHPRF